MGSNTYLVLGAGVGKAIAFILARSSHTQMVAIGDVDFNKTTDACRFVNKFSRARCVSIRFDAKENKNPVELFKKFDVVISALPAKYNLRLAEAAIQANVHFCDLGGIVEVTEEMLQLNDKYPNMPVSVVPDCGLMPGLGVIVAKKLMNDLDGAESLEILVGGLPQKPQPPTFYQKVFHPEGLKHICYDMAPILSNGEVVLVKPFHDYGQLVVPELQRFSKKFNGRIEAFVTAGASLAAWSFQDAGVRSFSEKTVRWPGFVDFFKNVPSDEFELAVEKNLTTPVNSKNPDLVWMRVTAKSELTGQKSMTLLDLYDSTTGLTAMQRTTGFPTAIMAEMMAERKTKPGVRTPENAFDRLGIDQVIDKVSYLIPLG